MSAIYINRIRRIKDEFVAAQGALAYVARNWQKQAIFNDDELEAVGPQDIKNAADNMEATFIIRVFAAFEGMLKEHLAQHHSGIAMPDDVSVAWLIDRVATLQTPHIGTPLRNNIHHVRRYRNSLVHADAAIVSPLQLIEVCSRLNTYLDKLPDPLS